MLICAILLLLFASCEKEEASNPNSNTTSGQESADSVDSTANSSNLYLLKAIDDNGKTALLYFYDDTLDTEIILCNKPNCNHNLSGCSAFFSSNATNAFLKEWRIFEKNNSLIIYAANNIYNLSADGTERKLLCEIPDKYQIAQCEYYNDSLFFLSTQYTVNQENVLESSTIDEVLQLPLSDPKLSVLYSADKEKIGLTQGALDNKLYLYYRETLNQQLPDSTQSSYDNVNNNLISRLISIDVSNGKRTELINKNAIDFDSVKQFDDKVVYHSRKDKKIYQYNLKDNTESVLGENIDGYIEIADFFVDGLLIYYIKNDNNYFFEPEKQNNETCFLTSNTKAPTLIEFKRNVSGKAVNILFSNHDNGVLYFDLDVEIVENIKDNNGDVIGVRYRNRKGRISKDDFAQKKYDQIEHLQWQTHEEIRRGK